MHWYLTATDFTVRQSWHLAVKHTRPAVKEELHLKDKAPMSIASRLIGPATLLICSSLLFGCGADDEGGSSSSSSSSSSSTSSSSSSSSSSTSSSTSSS